MLCSLTDEQYSDIMNVLSIYPYVTMNVSWGGIEWFWTNKKEFWYSLVFDDENEHKITAEAIITLTVHLNRENMSSLFSSKTSSSAGNVNVLDEEINGEQIDEKVNFFYFCFSEIFLSDY